MRERFIRALPEASLDQPSLPALIAELDGHSAYLSPAMEASMGRQSDQRYGGIGVKLGPGGVILARDPRGPALKAGLRLGDQLLALDGRPLQGRSPSALSMLLQGPVGSELRLRLRSAQDGAVYSRRLRRAALSWPTVRARRRGGLLYVKIRGFQAQTPAELDAVLKAQPGIQGLILDLRGNPGGALGAAVRVADRWLSGGRIAAVWRRGVAVKVERAHPRGTTPAYPIAVLIDGGTASAAELLAAALVERGRARSFGRPSFGKSHVQTVMQLPGGGALRLTVARYLTPSGRDLEGRGLAPQTPTPPGAGPEAALRGATAWLRGLRAGG